jgi:hypothetical protein
VIQAAQPSLSENPAIELLLLCARRQIGAETSRRILAIASGEPDWNALLAAAAEHSLTSLVCKNLQDCAGAALSAPWRERFSQSFFECSCRSLALTAELFRVLEAFPSRGVSATPYKGPVLASQAYGEIALREFSDLDIIVPQRQIASAHRTLLDLGFRPSCPAIAGIESPPSPRRIPGQYAYRKGAGTLVELHTEQTLRYFPATLDLEALCARRQATTLAGRQVLTFSAEDTLLLLSVHGAKHLWDRLAWIADIAALTKRSRQDWALVLERARSWRVQRMLLLGLGLAVRLFETPLPDEVTNCLERDKVAGQMIDQVSRRFFSAQKIQRGVLSRFAFRVRMRGALAQGLPYAIRLALMPTELDRGKRRLPDPLYALLRPLRLARTYGWRTRVGP